MMTNGQPILRPVSTWEEARRSLLSCATARAPAGALLELQRVCCDVWQDLWSQCCVKPVRTPVGIFGSLGVCIYVPASRHWLISYSPIHLT